MSRKELHTLKQRISDIAGHIKEQELLHTTIHDYMTKRESDFRNGDSAKRQCGRHVLRQTA